MTLKKTLLVCLMGATAATATARNPFARLNGNLPKEAIAMRNAILVKQMTPANAAKTTATAKRMSAMSFYDMGALEDTSRYTYRPYFGSFHPTIFSYVNEYDLSDPLSVQYIKYDSAYNVYFGQSQPELSVTVNGYNTAGANTSVLYTQGTDIYKDSVNYNGNGQPVTYTLYGSNGGPLAELVKRYRTFNTQGKVTLDSADITQNGGSVIKYTYTGALLTNMTQYQYTNGVSEVSYALDYTYDGQGRIATEAYSYASSGTLELSSRDSFGYTGTAAQYTFQGYQSWDAGTSSWEPVQEANIFVLNGANNPITMHYVEYNGGVITDTMERYSVTYNSSNLATNIKQQVYQGNGTYDAPFGEYNFYFEDYTTNSIADVANKGIAISLYPNPAQGAVTVSAEGAASYTVTDMQGRVLLQTTAQPKATTVNVSTLTAGNYIITVQNAQGAKLGSKLFSKQ